jgi:hypothetical protein
MRFSLLLTVYQPSMQETKDRMCPVDNPEVWWCFHMPALDTNDWGFIRLPPKRARYHVTWMSRRTRCEHPEAFWVIGLSLFDSPTEKSPHLPCAGLATPRH